MLRRRRFHRLLELAWWREILGEFDGIWHDLSEQCYNSLRLSVRQFPQPNRDAMSFPPHLIATLFDGQGGRVEYEPQMLGWVRQVGGQLEEILGFQKAAARWPEAYIISKGEAFRELRPRFRLIISRPLYIALAYLDQPVLQYRSLYIWQPDIDQCQEESPWLCWAFRAAYPITKAISDGMSFTLSSKQIALLAHVHEHGHEQISVSLKGDKRMVTLYSGLKHSWSSVADLLQNGYLQLDGNDLRTPEESCAPVAATLRIGIVGKMFMEQWAKSQGQ